MTPNPERLPKVLCVDDEPPLLRSLRWLLRREFDVAVASSGREALALLAADRFDVVLSDQRMPGMCGSEFLSLAQQVSPLTVRLLPITSTWRLPSRKSTLSSRRGNTGTNG